MLGSFYGVDHCTAVGPCNISSKPTILLVALSSSVACVLVLVIWLAIWRTAERLHI